MPLYVEAMSLQPPSICTFPSFGVRPGWLHHKNRHRWSGDHFQGIANTATNPCSSCDFAAAKLCLRPRSGILFEHSELCGQTRRL